MPLRSLLRMASSDDSTIAASCCAVRVDASSASRRRTSLSCAVRRADGSRHREGDLGRDETGELQFFRRQVARLREIQHELPDDSVGILERDEGQRGDPFSEEGLEKRREIGVLGHVGHDDRLGAFHAGGPRGVSLDRTPIAVRQIAPSLEAHHAVGIEQQDGRLLDTESALERIEGRLVNVLEPLAPIDRVCQLKADRQRSRCGGQEPRRPV